MKTPLRILSCCLCTGMLHAQQPLELGFEAGTLGEPPASWSVPKSLASTAKLTDTKAAVGTRSLVLLPGAKGDGGPGDFDNVVCLLDATPWRGRHVALRSRILVEGDGRAQMYLRVDCAAGRRGAFDNMHDRPIKTGDWQPATIELDVADDAEHLGIGFMSFGRPTLYIDDVTLTSLGDARPVQPATAAPLAAREVENLVAAARLLGNLRFFHPSRQAAALEDWDRFAVDLIAAAGPAKDAADLTQRLVLACAPIAPTVQIWAGSEADAPPLLPPLDGATALWSWEHKGAGRVAKADYVYRSKVTKKRLTVPLTATEYADNHVVLALGGGTSARIPFRVLVDAAAKAPAAVEAAAAGNRAPVLALRNRDTRLASVALAWTVFEHFYPYFDVTDVDWAKVLPETLADAADDADEAAFLLTMKRMVARLQDGHGGVYSTHHLRGSGLPVAMAWAGQDLVVVGKTAAVGDAVRRGEVIVSIDGRSTEACFRELAPTISAATPGYARHLSAYMFSSDLPTADPVVFEVRDAAGKVRSVALPRSASRIENLRPARPADGAELAAGVVYFNLDGAEAPALQAVVDKLAAAKGIVIDLRGYPGSAGTLMLQHLIESNSTSAQWQVPIVKTPFRKDWEWHKEGRWQLRPRAPHFGGKIAFLTDGRAISYAESVMGIVEAYKLGEIVGATTAGTNGNVNPFVLPCDVNVSWTGMRVLKHDGSRHHGVGIAPTVPVEPTAAGIAAGRDEVLERAVEVLQKQIGG